MIKGDFVVTGSDIEPIKFKSRAEARGWCKAHHPGSPITEIGPGGKRATTPPKSKGGAQGRSASSFNPAESPGQPADSRVREQRELNGGDNRPDKVREEGSAMTNVRESSRFGFCYALGELIAETATRYVYRNRAGVAFVSKNAPLIHITPCAGCADYNEKAA